MPVIFAFLQQQSKRLMSWQIQLNKALPVVASADVYSKVVALLLCINYCCSHSLWGLCIIYCFGLQYFVTFIVLKSTCWRREICLICLC